MRAEQNPNLGSRSLEPGIRVAFIDPGSGEFIIGDVIGRVRPGTGTVTVELDPFLNGGGDRSSVLLDTSKTMYTAVELNIQGERR